MAPGRGSMTFVQATACGMVGTVVAFFFLVSFLKSGSKTPAELTGASGTGSAQVEDLQRQLKKAKLEAAAYKALLQEEISTKGSTAAAGAAAGAGVSDAVALPASGNDVSFVGIFGFGVDPQRGNKYQKDDGSKIAPWRESCERLKLKCTVLNDIYTEGYAAKNTGPHLSFHSMQPVKADGTYVEPELNKLTTSDMRFMELLRYLKSPEGSSVEYALLTDAHDVQFLRDPLKLMRAMDNAMGTHYLFGQDEWRPRVAMNNDKEFTAMNRGKSYWRDCFGTAMPEVFTTDKFYNCALLGGHRAVLIPFLERMKYWYKKVPVNQRFRMCDMFVFARTILEDFNEHIITGYPFHAKFKDSDTGAIAAIWHKSKMPKLR
eukprot:TRINITY_DN45605_c0_g1_i1.p1 TRINITY_DN45605_c0_g1~~TRINITY_DN45605_c0_g1_i1.p1  ORF type:complete len:399 (-),score=95.33 TRINITY_DN45605_c0_g1_i1:546-1670(-)